MVGISQWQGKVTGVGGSVELRNLPTNGGEVGDSEELVPVLKLIEHQTNQISTHAPIIELRQS